MKKTYLNCDASDLNLYYDPDHPLWHKRPDWMLSVARGGTRMHPSFAPLILNPSPMAHHGRG